MSGRARELTKISVRPMLGSLSYGYGWDLSGDGSRLAFAEYGEREGRMHILPLSAGKNLEISVGSWRGLTNPFWAPSGRGVFVAAAAGLGTAVLYVDLEGGSQTIWRQRFPVINYPAIGIPSPDGRHLAVLAISADSNVWLLENF